jgi:hypothetical protein
MRQTKAAQIYEKTGNLPAVQLPLEHTKLESTVRYLGIEVDDALSSPSRSNSDDAPRPRHPVGPPSRWPYTTPRAPIVAFRYVAGGGVARQRIQGQAAAAL